jgi:hypothetical protein
MNTDTCMSCGESSEELEGDLIPLCPVCRTKKSSGICFMTRELTVSSKSPPVGDLALIPDNDT